MSINEKMVALADAIRSKTGETGKLSIDAMTTAVNNMSTGGASVETCTLTIKLGSRNLASTIYYTDSNLAAASTNMGMSTSKTITVLKNSVVYLRQSQTNDVSVSGACSVVDD